MYFPAESKNDNNLPPLHACTQNEWFPNAINSFNIDVSPGPEIQSEGEEGNVFLMFNDQIICTFVLQMQIKCAKTVHD